jgi:hypothetical protein
MGMNVCLFRRNSKQSFSVQLSLSSGVVEVHCTSILVDPPLKVDALEKALRRIGREEFGHLGGFDAFRRGWRVQVLKLGAFDVKARGFAQCKIRFEKVAEEEEASVPSSTDARQAVVKKKGMKWCLHK